MLGVFYPGQGYFGQSSPDIATATSTAVFAALGHQLRLMGVDFSVAAASAGIDRRATPAAGLDYRATAGALGIDRRVTGVGAGVDRIVTGVPLGSDRAAAGTFGGDMTVSASIGIDDVR